MKEPVRNSHTNSHTQKEEGLAVLLTPQFHGADGQNRTGDLLITNQLLCRLSYIGSACAMKRCCIPELTVNGYAHSRQATTKLLILTLLPCQDFKTFRANQSPWISFDGNITGESFCNSAFFTLTFEMPLVLFGKIRGPWP